MRVITQWVLATFTSPAGLFVLAVLDSTLFFTLPFGIDAAVIILAARSETLRWAVPCLATAGSVTGAALTFWMGMQIGDKGLERYVEAKRLERVRRRLKDSGAIALAGLNLIPPPFPFTPFILAAGALEVRKTPFFLTLVAGRLMRFGLEAALAVRYGRRILAWLNSDIVQGVVGGMIALAIVLTTISVVRVFRSARARPRQAGA
jgi:membrane protein YqaA with SNARE-associated domain